MRVWRREGSLLKFEDQGENDFEFGAVMAVAPGLKYWVRLAGKLHLELGEITKVLR